jgi:protoporphyrinogen oxidase
VNDRATSTPAPDSPAPAEPPVDAVVVGAGFTGLAAALELASAGTRVRIVESEPTVGGLASSFDVGSTRLERFYHHWFSSDREIFALCEELGVAHLLEPHETRTGVYHANSVYRLSAPLDVLRFAPLPFADRFRLGLLALRAQRVRDWRELESLTAEEWLVSLGGRRVYETVWRPLLRGKFGRYADRVGATWMWTKLHLRGGSRSRAGRETLYYLRGGCDALLTPLRARLESLGVRIHTASPARTVHMDETGVTGVTAGDAFLPARHVLVTTSPQQAAALLPTAADEGAGHPALPELRRRWNAVDYLGNVCLVLENRHRLSDTYWLNVNDPEFPYVGVIEHTNLDRPERYAGRHVVYLSKYLPTDAELYRMSDDEVLEYSVPHLKRMFPRFDRDWVVRHHVWRAPYAQPVITPHYSRVMPPVESTVRGLYLAGMAQVFPEDRGTNYALRNGRRAGRLVADRHRTGAPAPAAGDGVGSRG